MENDLNPVRGTETGHVSAYPDRGPGPSP